MRYGGTDSEVPIASDRQRRLGFVVARRRNVRPAELLAAWVQVAAAIPGTVIGRPWASDQAVTEVCEEEQITHWIVAELEPVRPHDKWQECRLLGAMLRGGWLLRASYLRNSAAAGRWLDDEQEQHEWGANEGDGLAAAAARRWRQRGPLGWDGHAWIACGCSDTQDAGEWRECPTRNVAGISEDALCVRSLVAALGMRTDSPHERSGDVRPKVGLVVVMVEGVSGSSVTKSMALGRDVPVLRAGALVAAIRRGPDATQSLLSSLRQDGEPLQMDDEVPVASSIPARKRVRASPTSPPAAEDNTETALASPPQPSFPSVVEVDQSPRVTESEDAEGRLADSASSLSASSTSESAVSFDEFRLRSLERRRRPVQVTPDSPASSATSTGHSERRASPSPNAVSSSSSPPRSISSSDASAAAPADAPFEPLTVQLVAYLTHLEATVRHELQQQAATWRRRQPLPLFLRVGWRSLRRTLEAAQRGRWAPRPGSALLTRAHDGPLCTDRYRFDDRRRPPAARLSAEAADVSRQWQKRDRVRRRAHRLATGCPSAPSWPPSVAARSTDRQRRRAVHRAAAWQWTRRAVASWSEAALKAWRDRHVNANAYYYRHTDPGQVAGQETQSLHAWTDAERRQFFAELTRWQRHRWRLGSCWGIFSKAVPTRCGYQCSNFYRACIRNGEVHDPTYDFNAQGELKRLHPEREDTHTVSVPESMNCLSECWQWEEVRQMEQQVDEWIRQLHPSFAAGLTVPAVRRVGPSMHAAGRRGARHGAVTAGRMRHKRPLAMNEWDERDSGIVGETRRRPPRRIITDSDDEKVELEDDMLPQRYERCGRRVARLSETTEVSRERRRSMAVSGVSASPTGTTMPRAGMPSARIPRDRCAPTSRLDRIVARLVRRRQQLTTHHRDSSPPPISAWRLEVHHARDKQRWHARARRVVFPSQEEDGRAEESARGTLRGARARKTARPQRLQPSVEVSLADISASTSAGVATDENVLRSASPERTCASSGVVSATPRRAPGTESLRHASLFRIHSMRELLATVARELHRSLSADIERGADAADTAASDGGAPRVPMVTWTVSRRCQATCYALCTAAHCLEAVRARGADGRATLSPPAVLELLEPQRLAAKFAAADDAVAEVEDTTQKDALADVRGEARALVQRMAETPLLRDADEDERAPGREVPEDGSGCAVHLRLLALARYGILMLPEWEGDIQTSHVADSADAAPPTTDGYLTAVVDGCVRELLHQWSERRALVLELAASGVAARKSTAARRFRRLAQTLMAAATAGGSDRVARTWQLIEGACRRIRSQLSPRTAHNTGSVHSDPAECSALTLTVLSVWARMLLPQQHRGLDAWFWDGWLRHATVVAPVAPSTDARLLGQVLRLAWAVDDACVQAADVASVPDGLVRLSLQAGIQAAQLTAGPDASAAALPFSQSRTAERLAAALDAWARQHLPRLLTVASVGEAVRAARDDSITTSVAAVPEWEWMTRALCLLCRHVQLGWQPCRHLVDDPWRVWRQQGKRWLALLRAASDTHRWVAHSPEPDSTPLRVLQLHGIVLLSVCLNAAEQRALYRQLSHAAGVSGMRYLMGARLGWCRAAAYRLGAEEATTGASPLVAAASVVGAEHNALSAALVATPLLRDNAASWVEMLRQLVRALADTDEPTAATAASGMPVVLAHHLVARRGRRERLVDAVVAALDDATRWLQAAAPENVSAGDWSAVQCLVPAVSVLLTECHAEGVAATTGTSAMGMVPGIPATLTQALLSFLAALTGRALQTSMPGRDSTGVGPTEDVVPGDDIALSLLSMDVEAQVARACVLRVLRPGTPAWRHLHRAWEVAAAAMAQAVNAPAAAPYAARHSGAVHPLLSVVLGRSVALATLVEGVRGGEAAWQALFTVAASSPLLVELLVHIVEADAAFAVVIPRFTIVDAFDEESTSEVLGMHVCDAAMRALAGAWATAPTLLSSGTHQDAAFSVPPWRSRLATEWLSQARALVRALTRHPRRHDAAAAVGTARHTLAVWLERLESSSALTDTLTMPTAKTALLQLCVQLRQATAQQSAVAMPPTMQWPRVRQRFAQLLYDICEALGQVVTLWSRAPTSREHHGVRDVRAFVVDVAGALLTVCPNLLRIPGRPPFWTELIKVGRRALELGTASTSNATRTESEQVDTVASHRWIALVLRGMSQMEFAPHDAYYVSFMRNVVAASVARHAVVAVARGLIPGLPDVSVERGMRHNAEGCGDNDHQGDWLACIDAVLLEGAVAGRAALGPLAVAGRMDRQRLETFQRHWIREVAALCMPASTAVDAASWADAELFVRTCCAAGRGQRRCGPAVLWAGDALGMMAAAVAKALTRNVSDRSIPQRWNAVYRLAHAVVGVRAMPSEEEEQVSQWSFTAHTLLRWLYAAADRLSRISYDDPTDASASVDARAAVDRLVQRWRQCGDADAAAAWIDTTLRSRLHSLTRHATSDPDGHAIRFRAHWFDRVALTAALGYPSMHPHLPAWLRHLQGYTLSGRPR